LENAWGAIALSDIPTWRNSWQAKRRAQKKNDRAKSQAKAPWYNSTNFLCP
jgi:hypothetical protein